MAAWLACALSPAPASAEFVVKRVTKNGNSAALATTEAEDILFLRQGDPVVLYGARVVRGTVLQLKDGLLFLMSPGAAFEVGQSFHSLEAGGKTVSRRFEAIRGYKHGERYLHFDAQRARLLLGGEFEQKSAEVFSPFGQVIGDTRTRATAVPVSLEYAVRPTWIAALDARWIVDENRSVKDAQGNPTTKGQVRNGIADLAFRARVHLLSRERDLVLLASASPALFRNDVTNNAFVLEGGLGYGIRAGDAYPFVEATGGRYGGGKFSSTPTLSYEKEPYLFYRARAGSEYDVSRDLKLSANLFFSETSEITYGYSDNTSLVYQPLPRYGVEAAIHVYEDKTRSLAVNGSFFLEMDQDVSFLAFSDATRTVVASRGKVQVNRSQKGFLIGMTFRAPFY